MRLWGNFNMTHARNEILVKDDPELYPAYQKQSGYSINQNRTFVDAGYVNNYSEVLVV